jgi:hypothetical protein
MCVSAWGEGFGRETGGRGEGVDKPFPFFLCRFLVLFLHKVHCEQGLLRYRKH